MLYNIKFLSLTAKIGVISPDNILFYALNEKFI